MKIHLYLIAALFLITLAGQSHAHEYQQEQLDTINDYLFGDDLLMDWMKNRDEIEDSTAESLSVYLAWLVKLDLQLTLSELHSHINDTGSCVSRDLVIAILPVIKQLAKVAREYVESGAERMGKELVIPPGLKDKSLDLYWRTLNVCEED